MRVLNIGSLNIDYVYVVPHHVRPGETIASLDRQVFPGGKGLNQSVALAKAGAAVRHGGAVGAADGALLLEALREHGVDTSAVLMRGCASGHAIIQVDPQGQNSIVIHGGVNRTISRDEIMNMLEDYGSGDRLVLQNEINADALCDAISLAAARGLYIVFNPSPVDAKLRSFPLEKTGCLVLNEVEAEVLTGSMEPQTQLDTLRRAYPRTDLLLTLGAQGAIFAPHSKAQVYTQQAYRVQAIDTTAAGDTFLGFFIALYNPQQDPSQALRLAAAAAAICVTRQGASASIPSLAEVIEFAQREK